MGSEAEQMRRIADRLGGIAASVSDEAGALTQAIRLVGDHARTIAALAGELDGAMQAIEERVQGQLTVLKRARHEAENNEPVMAALAGSAVSIAEMARLVGEIAGQSRLLSLNARIEAARAGASGGGFASVATAMTELSMRTHETTQGIHARADTIGDNVAAAREVIDGGVQLLEREQRMIGGIAEATSHQRAHAAEVANLTAEAVAEIDEAALGIGRVASAASVVGVLARQITRLAGADGGDQASMLVPSEALTSPPSTVIVSPTT